MAKVPLLKDFNPTGPSWENVNLKEDASKAEQYLPYDPKLRRLRQYIWALCICNVLLLLAGVRLALHWTVDRPREHLDPSLGIYSPANEEVEYLEKRFNRSRGTDKSEFQGWPNDEIDEYWRRHYIPAILTTIDEETARKLPKQTARFPWPGRESEYVVTLDVFHQMHCLDIVRMSLYRDRYDKHFYNPDGTVDYCKWLHVDHCLDQVRQALMCQADVSVVNFEWSEIVQGLRPMVDNMHVCRNYERILSWASKNGVSAEMWHPSHRVVQDQNGSFVIEVGRNHAAEDGNPGECNAI